jgi:hypothetical protein
LSVAVALYSHNALIFGIGPTGTTRVGLIYRDGQVWPRYEVDKTQRKEKKTSGADDRHLEKSTDAQKDETNNNAP